MSSFATDGFCSSEIRKNIRIIRHRSNIWFDFCLDLNRCLQQIVYEVGGTRGTLFTKDVVTSAIYLRSISSFQGTINLAERGMHISGYALVRQIYEDSLCISATSSNWEHFKKMFEEDLKASRRKQMQFMLQSQNLDLETQNKLKEIINKTGKSQTLNMKKIASLGPLEKQYLFYQIISANASHCSADSLRSQVVIADNKSAWNGFRFGPSSKESIDALLWAACGAALPVALGCAEILKNDPQRTKISDWIFRFRNLPSQETEMIKSFRENV